MDGKMRKSQPNFALEGTRCLVKIFEGLEPSWRTFEGAEKGDSGRSVQYFSPTLPLRSLFQFQYLIVLERLVATGDDAFARFQTFVHLVVLRVLTANADVAAVCLGAGLVENEYPVASCGLEEGAFGDEDGLRWFA